VYGDAGGGFRTGARLLTAERCAPLEGESAREPSTVCRRSVRREHELDRQPEERTQAGGDRLVGDTFPQPLTGISNPRPKSASVSPTMTARRLSTQSTRSFGSRPGNASCGV